MATTTVAKIIALAKKQVGTVEKENNNVPYNTLYYGREVKGNAYPYCCVGIWYLFDKLNANALFYGGKKTASCTVLYNYHKAKGQVVKTPKAGDLVFFKFTGNTIKHVGLVTGVNKNGSINTIEFNTSAGNNGSQDNGEGVYARVRYASQIYGYIRPNYSNNIVSKAVATTTAAVKKATSSTASKVSTVTNKVLSNKVTYTKGQKVKLSKAPLFASATSKTKCGYKTDTFYIWDSTVKNDRIRITNNKKLIGKANGVTGWINVSDL